MRDAEIQQGLEESGLEPHHIVIEPDVERVLVLRHAEELADRAHAGLGAVRQRHQAHAIIEPRQRLQKGEVADIVGVHPDVVAVDQP